MIVRQADAVIHLITQPDHAALSRRIMEHWGTLRALPRRPSILLAIEQHDNGWREVDAAPTIDPSTGAVHDFVNAPVDIRQGVWPRGITRLSYDRWAAALVAQHALTIYERYQTDGAWTTFFADIEETRDKLLLASGATLQELKEHYQYVRVGDLMSLMFCTDWDEEKYGQWTFRRRGARVSIVPDPFRGREIPIDVPAWELPDRRFTSDEDLRTAMRGAHRVTLRGVIDGRG